MIQPRLLPAGISTVVYCRRFRATGITPYLKNRGRQEVARRMTVHKSGRTTGLYDRRGDDISLHEAERIAI